MSSEPLHIFDPRRNLQLQGFAGRAATTTIHDATETGVSISGFRFLVHWALRREELCDPGLCADAPEDDDQRCDHCPLDRSDADIEMTRRKAFPAILPTTGP